MREAKKITRVTTTKVVSSFKFDGDDIVNALQRLGYQIPKDAEVLFTVPGGADWSGTEIDLNDYPIEVKWTEETVT